MVIFGKKKEAFKDEIPNLPELPNFSNNSKDYEIENEMNSDYNNENNKIDSQIKDLPSFPDTDFGDSFSQEAVKSAIEPQKNNNFHPVETKETRFILPKSIEKSVQHPVSMNFSKQINKPIYQEAISPVYDPLPKVEPISLKNTNNSINYASQSKIIPNPNEPVYIRIDKFKFALDSFQNVKDKILEVEKYLNEIKEQKKREDEELKEWENQIEAIKLRIEGIDNKIFSKV